MSRVFRDRLLETKDEELFDDMIVECMKPIIDLLEEESKNKNSVIETGISKVPKIQKGQIILFGDFIDKENDFKVYKEIEDLQKLTTVLEETLDDYNNEHQPMNLIMFSDCCEHVSRLCRILGFPRGNALLMGVGGSGRQSCTKLANYTIN